MKSIRSSWFVCKMRYDQTQQSGLLKQVTEQYVVDALSFTEAESRFIEEMSSYTNGEHEVLAISRAPFSEVYLSDDMRADKWYKIKLAFLTLDENTGKEKRTTFTYLVQATDLETARKDLETEMSRTSLSDYVTVGVNETKIIDVFLRHKEA